ncbi:MAG: hypothetical protein RL748_2872 [Pseudomonadota bacterium]
MKNVAKSLMLFAGTAMLADASFASGYGFAAQSASNLGLANSGGAAAQDATTIFYNPAGLSRLPGVQASGVFNYQKQNNSFADTGSLTVLGAPSGGNNGGNFSRSVAEPHAFFSYQFNDKVTFGMGIFIPYQLHTKYQDGWAGRYQSTESKIQTRTFNPSLAYKMNEIITFGAGISAQYFDATVAKGLDLGSGSIAQINANPNLPAANKAAIIAAIRNGLGTNPSLYDGAFSVSGDDWAWGVNVGLLLTLSEDTRLGLAYRSSIKHTVHGKTAFVVPTSIGTIPAAGPTILAGLNAALQPTDATLPIETPDTMSVNLYHRINPQWAVTGDYTLTKTSRLQELRVSLAGAPDNVIAARWRDSSRFSFGGMYQPDAKWTFSAGIAREQASQRDDTERLASIPDGDKTWFSFGVRHAFDAKHSLDIAGALIRGNDFNIARGALTSTEVTSGKVNGQYSQKSWMVGIQYNHRF